MDSSSFFIRTYFAAIAFTLSQKFCPLQQDTTTNVADTEKTEKSTSFDSLFFKSLAKNQYFLLCIFTFCVNIHNICENNNMLIPINHVFI